MENTASTEVVRPIPIVQTSSQTSTSGFYTNGYQGEQGQSTGTEYSGTAAAAVQPSVHAHLSTSMSSLSSHLSTSTSPSNAYSSSRTYPSQDYQSHSSLQPGVEQTEHRLSPPSQPANHGTSNVHPPSSSPTSASQHVTATEQTGPTLSQLHSNPPHSPRSATSSVRSSHRARRATDPGEHPHPQSLSSRMPSSLKNDAHGNLADRKPSADTFELQDVIAQFGSQPELLKLILSSKVEEDKRKTEEAKLKVKELDLLLLERDTATETSSRHSHTSDSGSMSHKRLPLGVTSRPVDGLSYYASGSNPSIAGTNHAGSASLSSLAAPHAATSTHRGYHLPSIRSTHLEMIGNSGAVVSSGETGGHIPPPMFSRPPYHSHSVTQGTYPLVTNDSGGASSRSFGQTHNRGQPQTNSRSNADLQANAQKEEEERINSPSYAGHSSGSRPGAGSNLNMILGKHDGDPYRKRNYDKLEENIGERSSPDSMADKSPAILPHPSLTSASLSQGGRPTSSNYTKTYTPQPHSQIQTIRPNSPSPDSHSELSLSTTNTDTSSRRKRKRREMQAVTMIVETKQHPHLDNFLWKNNGNTTQRKTGNKSVYYKCSNSNKGCPVNKTVTQGENGTYLIKYRGEHLPECGKVKRIVD
ncbi:hypothetical protein BZG36_01856 [Bifiguratus adelaidae]|uniref:WRKY domain-containing protein n=1 Tax=Bifiguratus adelaidae TaxID=1938954 RepID=A0A261Y2I1_9FUNG|nr:hypothetical protein BZG36_01856 [Bifiguratus adelaidae]